MQHATRLQPSRLPSGLRIGRSKGAALPVAVLSAASLLLATSPDAFAQRGGVWAHHDISAPQVISVELASDLLAWDLCWSKHTDLARARVANAVIAQMTDPGRLHVVRIAGLSPTYVPPGRAPAAQPARSISISSPTERTAGGSAVISSTTSRSTGVIRDLNGDVINAKEYTSRQHQYHVDLEAAMIDIAARIREARPGAKLTFEGFEIASLRPGVDAYRTLGEVQDFYFSDRTIYLNRVNGMLAQALASNFFRTRVEFAERHNRWLVFPNHTGEFSLASISTPNWPPSEFEPEILALWGGNGEEEGGGSVAVVIPSLTPGAGWQGPTLQPEGSGFASDLGWDAKPVARWNVVPYQDVNEPFQLGVVAFHMNGIDRVEFSVDNGPWEVVHNADRNPRTGTEEYSVILDPAKFAQDGRVEVRAIVYPDGAGIPRVLAGPVAFQGAEQGYNAPDLDEYGYPTNALWTGEHSLELFVNPNGTLVEQVVELDAGVYVWGQPPLTAPVGASSGPGVQVDRDRWITFRAKPGLNREDVVISGTVTTRPWTAPDGSRWTVDYSRVKFEGLTILSGDLNTAGTPRLPRYLSRAMLWLENSHLKGEGQFKNTGSMHVAHGFYTNSTISDTRTAIGSDSIYSSGNFVRGCELLNIGEKGIRSGYFVANTKIDGVFRGPQTSWHSSAISNPISYENRIYFDLDILDAIQAFAFRSESWNLYRHRDVALVDVHATHGGDMNNYLMFLGGTVENMIVRDSSFSSSGSGFTWSYRMNLPPDDPRFFRPHTLVYESVIWNGSANAIPGPFPLEGIYVR